MPNHIQQLPLSLIILAHQDSPTLWRAIESVPFARELVIAWDTPDLPRELIKKVYDHTKQAGQTVRWLAVHTQAQGFAVARNQALRTASESWVCFLDSDEWFPPDAQHVFPKVFGQLLKNDQHVAGASFLRRDFFMNQPVRWGEVHDVRVSRVFRKRNVRFVRKVHEYPIVQGTVLGLPVAIYHTPHDSIFTFVQKISRYARAHEAALREEGQHFAWWRLSWPVGKFCWNYFFRLGFMDGWRGVVYAIIMSLHSLATWTMMYEQEHGTKDT